VYVYEPVSVLLIVVVPEIWTFEATGRLEGAIAAVAPLVTVDPVVGG
jgi:hypothetical protein